MFERSPSASAARASAGAPTASPRGWSRIPDAARDPEVRHRFGEIATDFLALRFTGYRTLTTLQRGGIPGPEGGLAKVTTIKAAIDAASCSPTCWDPTPCGRRAGGGSCPTSPA
jgi:hypothetical protein